MPPPEVGQKFCEICKQLITVQEEHARKLILDCGHLFHDPCLVRAAKSRLGKENELLVDRRLAGHRFVSETGLFVCPKAGCGYRYHMATLGKKLVAILQFNDGFVECFTSAADFVCGYGLYLAELYGTMIGQIFAANVARFRDDKKQEEVICFTATNCHCGKSIDDCPGILMVPDDLIRVPEQHRVDHVTFLETIQRIEARHGGREALEKRFADWVASPSST